MRLPAPKRTSDSWRCGPWSYPKAGAIATGEVESGDPLADRRPLRIATPLARAILLDLHHIRYPLDRRARAGGFDRRDRRAGDAAGR
jgi:hypothetical protein